MRRAWVSKPKTVVGGGYYLAVDKPPIGGLAEVDMQPDYFMGGGGGGGGGGCGCGVPF